jgi:hypothetical protein
VIKLNYCQNNIVQTLHYIYFNRKNITIFIPEGINSIEYLLHREKIFTGTINYPEEHLYVHRGKSELYLG